MGLKILWTLPYAPWPLIGGPRVRQWHLLRNLAARGHRITLLVQSKLPLDDVARSKLTPLVERLIVLDRRPRKHPLTLAAALFAPYPVVVSVNGLSQPLRKVMAALLDEQWDAVQIEHSYGLQSFLPLLQQRRQPFLLVEHNVESTLVATTSYHPRLPAFLLPLLRRYDGWRYRRWERRALRLPARLIAMTQEDADSLSAISGRAVDIVTVGIDIAEFASVHPDTGSRRVLFIGNFEYPPNAEAVQWAAQDILPRVWQQLPDVRFVVCGHGLPDTWRQRWSDPRIEWKGYVDDLKAEMSRSAALLAPLQAGGGVKVKVLESMAAGLAVVTTPEGVSGLTVEDGQEYYEGRTAQELADRLIELLPDAEKLRLLGESGRAYVQRGRDWRAITDQLEEIYREMPVRS